MTTEMKTCTKCKNELLATVEFFIKDKRKANGLNSWCRNCHREHMRNKAREKKPELLEKDLLRSQGLKKCTACCKALPETEEFFHIDGRRKHQVHGKYYPMCKSCWTQKGVEFREEYPEKFRAYTAKWKQAHPEYNAVVAERKRIKVSQNREHYRELSRRWMRANKPLTRAANHRRRALIRGSEKHFSPEDVIRLMNEQQGKCQYCNCDIQQDFHVDHIIPLSRGGDNSAENICLACEFCNISKHNKLLSEWVSPKLARG